MESPARPTGSNTNLSGYNFPEETPDTDRRRTVRIQEPQQNQEPQQQNNMSNIQQNDGRQAGDAQQNVNPPESAATDNKDVWCVNPMIVDYNPGTRTGQEIFKTKQEEFLKQTSLRL